MSWQDFLLWIGPVIVGIRQFLGLTQDTIKTTQSATEALNAGKRLLHISADDADAGADQDTGSEPTDRDVERARAMADLIRSFAIFGFLEYLLWATRAVLMLVALLRMQASVERVLTRSGRDKA